MCPGSSPAGGAARQALFGSDYMYCLMSEPSSIDTYSEFTVISISLFHVRVGMLSPSGKERADIRG